MKRFALASATLMLLATTACSDDGGDASPIASPTSAAVATGPASISLASSSIGDVVVGQGGMSVYLFVPDGAKTPTCVDACLDRWPIVAEVAEVGDGLDASLLGHVTHPNGTEQATYNGWPLYYFGGDTAAGDTNGQGVGDVWFTLDAAGAANS